MRLFLSVFALCGLLSQSINTFAQFEGVDLNKYKLTDYIYKSLTTDLSTSNSNGFSKSSISNPYGSSDYKSRSNSINAGARLGYSSNRYRRNYSGTQNIGIDFNTRFNHGYLNSTYDDLLNNNNTFESSYSESNFSININSSNRFYNSNNFFIGFDIQSGLTPNHSYLESDNTSGSSSHNASILKNTLSSDNSLSLYFGKGRFENVTDARLAIYILDDLLKQGRLSRTPNQEEVFAFADFITKTLNKRVIDSRIKKDKESVAIDSFLTSNGLSKVTDGLYFGLINDNWNYGRSQEWETGNSWDFGITSSFNYQNLFYKRIDTTSITKNWNRLNEYRIGLSAGFSSSWISGLKWIRGYEIRGAFNVYEYDSSGYFGNYNYRSFSGNVNYFIKFIPNTRTDITCRSGASISKYNNKGVSDNMQINPFISGSCNYYFSERIRFHINAGLSYGYNKLFDFTNTQKSLNFGINASLSYYIF